MRKIIVQDFNLVSEARLNAFKGGGLEPSNSGTVWSVELSKQAIMRMRSLDIAGHRGEKNCNPQDQ